MLEERLLVGAVPTSLYEPVGARGLLLLGHGGGHGKDGPRFVRLARRYAEKTRLAVVCIDAVTVSAGPSPRTTACREVGTPG